MNERGGERVGCEGRCMRVCVEGGGVEGGGLRGWVERGWLRGVDGMGGDVGKV